jgi:hypothetical protein
LQKIDEELRKAQQDSTRYQYKPAQPPKADAPKKNISEINKNDDDKRMNVSTILMGKFIM